MADNPKSGVNTGTEVTTQIETSSNGKKPKKHKVIKGCLTVFVIFFVLSLIIGFASGNKSNSSQTSSSESSESSSTQTSTQSLQQTPVVDKTELEKAISSVGTLVQADYTTDSWQVVQNALQIATDTDSKSDATQSEVDRAKTVLNNAILNLEKAADQVPIEYKNALVKAQLYSDQMHFSYARLYDQLTSSYGEGFSAEAAQYAVDNVEADWNANALAKAKEYQSEMAMSPSKIYDQLTSDYGEKFTDDQANYAIAHLND
jgi:flagellar basal body-associated protein FliL